MNVTVLLLLLVVIVSLSFFAKPLESPVPILRPRPVVARDVPEHTDTAPGPQNVFVHHLPR